MQLALIPGADVATVDAMVARSGLRDGSLRRYLGPARAWLLYCDERSIPPWDAPTPALLAWLDSRVRDSSSPRSALKLSLAAARWLQRRSVAELGHDCVPYTPAARVQLDAYARSVTLISRAPVRARALRVGELASIVDRVRRDVRPRQGTDLARANALAHRDAAMLLVGWWGALRADDLARLEWSHVFFEPLGVELRLPDSKTGACVLALASRDDAPILCPRRALSALGMEGEGRVFGLSSGAHVSNRLATVFRRAGLPRGYTGHSLRAGFATECASQGVPDKLVQAHCRWRSAQQHAEYVRSGRLWQDTPTAMVAV